VCALGGSHARSRSGTASQKRAYVYLGYFKLIAFDKHLTGLRDASSVEGPVGSQFVGCCCCCPGLQAVSCSMVLNARPVPTAQHAFWHVGVT
jgi:hypothetical protein